MAPLPIALNGDFRYVLAASALLPAIGFFHSINTLYWRAQSKTKFPLLFADESVKVDPKIDAAKKRFNCAQKAHLQFTENVNLTLLAGWITGVSYPKEAAGLIAVWAISRFLYVLAYSTGEPNRRMPPNFFNITSQIALVLSAIVTSFKAIA